jgi:phosphonate transport system permease protein
MTISIHHLPDRQLAPLLAAYGHAVAKRRLRFLVGVLTFVSCVAFAVWWVQFDLLLLVRRLGEVSSYFSRLIHLDSGALVFTDPLDWFWGFIPWLKLLVETLLIAYTGTLLGALGGFLYWNYVGCASGTCMITSKPINSTLYGALMGYLLFGIFKKEKTAEI